MSQIEFSKNNWTLSPIIHGFLQSDLASAPSRCGAWFSTHEFGLALGTVYLLSLGQ